MKTIEDAVRKLGGVWPAVPGIDPEDDKPGVLYRAKEILLMSNGPGDSPPCTHICTRTEFDECVARLRNEPDLKDEPDWAKAKAQDRDGSWWWYSAVPSEGGIMFNSNDQVVFACRGEVIGDWKDTLRLRPAENKMGTKNEGMTHQEAERNRRANEVPSAPDNDWYKRGGFPPAGTVCEVLYDDVWEQTKIIGWNNDAIVITTEWDDSFSYDGLYAEPSDFRPIKTERERLIEKACKVAVDSYCIEDTVKSLADAGMLKMPEEK